MSTRSMFARRGGSRPRSHTCPRAPRIAAALLSGALASGAARSDTFPLPPRDVDLVGHPNVARTTDGDTLLDVARLYDIGQEEILHANPKVDRWLPRPNTKVLIPSLHVLPRAERKGIVLNLPEMRLYYFRTDTSPPTLVTYPVSVGRMDWTTPLGTTKIVAKERDPSWTPPATVKAEHAAEGDYLPDVVPPGPNNPLGRFALRLGVPGYLLHGTNKPYGVGMRVSHGCIRLYPEDIEELFDRVPIGTPVQIVNQPIKLGWVGDLLFIEVHAPLEEDNAGTEELMRQAVDLISAEIANRPTAIDGSDLSKAVEEQTGIPVLISRAAPSPADVWNPTTE